MMRSWINVVEAVEDIMEYDLPARPTASFSEYDVVVFKAEIDGHAAGTRGTIVDISPKTGVITIEVSGSGDLVSVENGQALSAQS
jgi:hypothetical protein